MKRMSSVGKGRIFGTGVGLIAGAKIGTHVGIAMLGTAIPGTLPVAVTLATVGHCAGAEIGRAVERNKY